MYQIFYKVTQIALDLNLQLCIWVVLVALCASPGYIVYIINASFDQQKNFNIDALIIISLTIIDFTVFGLFNANGGESLHEQVSCIIFTLTKV